MIGRGRILERRQQGPAPPGRQHQPVDQTLDQVNIKPYVSQICNHEGIFEQNYINGDLIKENQTFGQIYDLDGSVVEDCLTTSSGRFLGGGNKGGYVKVGDEIGIIQPEIKY